MNGRSVKTSNMKSSERKIRPNKSGENRINMHENTIYEEYIRDFSSYQNSKCE
jgi:hypothetical protein